MKIRLVLIFRIFAMYRFTNQHFHVEAQDLCRICLLFVFLLHKWVNMKIKRSKLTSKLQLRKKYVYELEKTNRINDRLLFCLSISFRFLLTSSIYAYVCKICLLRMFSMIKFETVAWGDSMIHKVIQEVRNETLRFVTNTGRG